MRLLNNAKEPPQSKETVAREDEQPLSQTVDEFIATAPEPPAPVVDSLILVGSFVMVAGPPGVGKTHLILELARAVVKGEAAFGKFPAQKGKVLLVLEEHHPAYLKERFLKAGMANTPVHVIHRKRLRLDKKDWVKRLADEANRVDATLVVLDPFADLHTSDENDAEGMQPVLDGLETLKTSCPSTGFVVVHHLNKGAWNGGVPSLSDIRGSSTITGKFDIAYALMPKTKDEGALSILLTCLKNKEVPECSPQKLTMRFTEEGTIWEASEAPRTTAQDTPKITDEEFRRRFEAKLREAHKTGKTFRNPTALKAAVTGNAAKKKQVLDALIQDGTVVHDAERNVIYLAEEGAPPTPATPATNDG